MKVGFIIPVYKNPKQLKGCLKHIDELKTKHKISVYQHDNSVDNIGFTKAVNLGLSFFDGKVDYCVVLNQDCYVKPDFINKAVEFMDANPKCAIGGAKQLLDDNQNYIIHGGCTTAFPTGRHIVGDVSKGGCAENKRMPWVNGACMIVNMKLLHIFGVMDENYFLIGSDSDWCYTARQRNLEVWYIADAVVSHEQGVSTKVADDDLEFKKLLDMTYFRDKWITDGSFRELQLEVLG